MKLTNLQQHYLNTFKYLHKHQMESFYNSYRYYPNQLQKYKHRKQNKHLHHFMHKNKAKIIYANIGFNNHNLSPTQPLPHSTEILIHINNTPCILQYYTTDVFHIYVDLTEEQWHTMATTRDNKVLTRLGIDINNTHIFSDDKKLEQELKQNLQLQYTQYSEEEMFQLSLLMPDPVLYTTIQNVLLKLKELNNPSVLQAMTTIFKETEQINETN